MEEFVHKTLKLLEQEREAEIAETGLLLENTPVKELQRRGVCLLKLCVRERKTGLYGRTVLKFGLNWDGKELPSHNFCPGDIAGVGLSQGSTKEIVASGIVSHVSQYAVSVAFDETNDSLDLDESASYKMVKLANDVTYTRLKRGLENLRNYRSGPSSSLIDVLFGLSEPSPPMPQARDGGYDVVYFNENLDGTQKEAVEFALHQREVSVVHGPPGTGKTTTVVEIIRQAVKQGLKVLACAPSNIAVDNLVERLADHMNKIIRLGHPARLLPKIQKYSLDALLASSDDTQLVKDVRSDMDKALLKMKKCRNAGERSALRDEMKSLRKEVRQREEAATKGLLTRAQVVLATLTGLSEGGPLKLLDEHHFDIVVIDECSQALEAACWLALLKARRCVLAGDHLQLPPTIMSSQAAKGGLEVTLMERVLKVHGTNVMRMLTMQYRMNEHIMRWPSDRLYDGKLTAHPSVASHLLRDLPGVAEAEETLIPVLLIDTAGCDLNELNLPSEVSKGNEGEADIVSHHIDKLVGSGVKAENIAVITPYNLQVELLRLRLSDKYPKLEIKSVDGFQGREKEAVVMSLVRSNDQGEVGFLAEDRRINVAVTRARRHLAVVGDTDTISQHAFLKSLVDYMMESGEVKSADQYITEGALKTEHSRPEYLDEQMANLSKKTEDVKRKGKGQKVRSGKKKSEVQGQTKGSEVSKGREHQGRENGAKFKSPKTAEQLAIEEKEENELRDLLVTFTEDERKTEHEFSSVLTSRQRFLVHKLAEEMGLNHRSEGDGDDRRITVTKQRCDVTAAKRDSTSAVTKQHHGTTITKPLHSTAVTKQRDNVSGGQREQETEQAVAKAGQEEADESFDWSPDTTQEVTSQANSARGEADDIDARQLQEALGLDSCTVEDEINAEQSRRSDFSTCPKCGKDVPKNNLALHEIRCRIDKAPQNGARPKTTEQKPKTSGQEPSTAKSNKKKKGKTKQTKGEDDFDALIAEANQLNTVCNFPKCKTLTTVLGQTCEFCVRRFCLTHHIPEPHGCGDAAKTKARTVITKEGVLYRGSGVPNKKPDPQKKAFLQRKLDKKLSEMSESRRVKKKEK